MASARVAAFKQRWIIPFQQCWRNPPPGAGRRQSSANWLCERMSLLENRFPLFRDMR
jgi:hypothetical protein